MSELSMREFCPVSIHLNDARICINCDHVHTGWMCPRCLAGPSYWLAYWIEPITQRIRKTKKEIDDAH